MRRFVITAMVTALFSLVDLGNGVAQVILHGQPAEPIPVLEKANRDTALKYFQNNWKFPENKFKHILRAVTIDVKEKLKQLGFDPGEIDGVIDSDTIRAIKQFQEKFGDRPTGKLTKLEIDILYRKTDPIGEPQKRIRTKRRSSSSSQWQARKTQNREIQNGLNELGYDAGVADGTIGPKSEQAIRHFQMAHNQPNTGRMSETDLIIMRQELNKLQNGADDPPDKAEKAD